MPNTCKSNGESSTLSVQTLEESDKNLLANFYYALQNIPTHAGTEKLECLMLNFLSGERVSNA